MQLSHIFIITWTWLLIGLPWIYLFSHAVHRSKMLNTAYIGIIISWTSSCSAFKRIYERLWPLCELRTVSSMSPVFIITRSWSTIFPVYEPLVNRLAPFRACCLIFCWNSVSIRTWYMVESFVVDKFRFPNGLAHRP